LKKNYIYKLNVFCDYCPFSLKGGIEKALVKDIQNLKEKCDINVFATCDAWNCEEKWCNKNSNVKFHIIHGRYETKLDMMLANMKLLFKILKVSRDVCFQVVHVNSNKSGFPAFLASRMLKSRLVVSVHYVWPFCVKGTLLKDERVHCDFEYGNLPYPNVNHCLNECFKKANVIEKTWVLFSYFFDQLLIKKADSVICLNEDAQKRLIKLGVNPHKINFIPNPVHVEKVGKIDKIGFRKKFGISENEKMVLFSGRICPEKGLEMLILAMKKLPEHVKLVMAGRIEVTDGFFQKICDLIKKLKLEKRVFFSGFLNGTRLSSAYAACDVFVYPTLSYEMFGTSVFEALMFKKPVVISSFGGPASLLKNDRAALVESSDVYELSNAISRCLFDSSYAEKIATNGFNFAKRLHVSAIWRKRAFFKAIYSQ